MRKAVRCHRRGDHTTIKNTNFGPAAAAIQFKGEAIHHQLVVGVTVIAHQPTIGATDGTEGRIAFNLGHCINQRNFSAERRTVSQIQQRHRGATRYARVVEHQLFGIGGSVLQVDRARCTWLCVLR